MLEGKLGFVEGCRLLVQICRQFDLPDSDSMDTIVAIESETDDVPVGAEREKWAPEALRKKDRQCADYLDQVRTPLKLALETLAGRR